LISQKSILSAVKPAYSSAFSDAGTGHHPITVGSTHAKPIETILAIGSRPLFFASSASIDIQAVAPASKGEEFPAVIIPSLVPSRFS